MEDPRKTHLLGDAVRQSGALVRSRAAERSFTRAKAIKKVATQNEHPQVSRHFPREYPPRITLLGSMPGTKKQQMGCEFHKIASAIHTILFADWTLEAEIHNSWAIVGFLTGSWSEKTEPNEQRTDRKG